MLEIATVLEGAHVTMLRMARVLLALVLLAVPACSDAAAGRDPDAARALEAVTDLEREVATLRAELDGLTEEGSELDKKLGRLGDRLDNALGTLRDSIGNVRGSAGTAADEAASALSRAESVAAQLQVLEERYEYHLRRYHGGG